ncbi:helix-turn-helix domain-containing protein [Geobacter sp. FeAm09]|nr:helix-turn-helix domain-containing protein [Geobacter sp. FeAm09]
MIRDALASTGGRKQEAARLLNISRKTLWQKLKQMKNG